jgi:putative FmdB family regulatory protein
MPIYEYRCSSCGHELEALQKLSDAPLVACPSCKTDALVKQVSAAGFQLKGSGWYATDFKGGGKTAAKKPDAESKSGAESTSDSKSGSKSDSAPESKPETKSDGKAADKSGEKSAAPASSTGSRPACS